MDGALNEGPVNVELAPPGLTTSLVEPFPVLKDMDGIMGGVADDPVRGIPDDKVKPLRGSQSRKSSTRTVAEGTDCRACWAAVGSISTPTRSWWGPYRFAKAARKGASPQAGSNTRARERDGAARDTIKATRSGGVATAPRARGRSVSLILMGFEAQVSAWSLASGMAITDFIGWPPTDQSCATVAKGWR